MNSFTNSITNSLRLYVELDNIDNLEIKPLLKRSKSAYYDRLIPFKENEVISNRILERQCTKLILDDPKAPPDKFYIAALIAFFSGVAAVLPMSFFIVANDYWMFKFRDSTQASYDLNNKTFLQTIFVSMLSVVSFPSVISLVLSILYSHKIKLRNRFLLLTGIEVIIFLLFIIFIEVDTDSWQTLFFILTVSLFGIIIFVTPFFGMANMSFLSKLPSFYMQLNMLGTAISGLFGTSLQIISLTVGRSSTEIALIYFSSGWVVIVFTFFLMYMMKYSLTIQFYTQKFEEEKYKQKYTLREYLEVGKKIWFLLVINAVCFFTTNIGHPNITNLVVSEGYTGSGQNLWNDKYFVPVATYLLFDIFQILGRLFGRPLITRETAVYFIIFTVFRGFILTPLLWFCNAQPRHHLPVLFSHNYQYMIIAALCSFTGSIIFSMMFISLPPIAGAKSEQALNLMMAVSTVANSISSPLSPIYVNLL